MFAGANVDAIDDIGYTPLMNSSSAGYALVANALIQAKCNCNIFTQSGLSALHIACKSSSTCIIQLLLMAGSNVNCVTDQGQSPLSMTVQYGTTQDVQVLLLSCTYADPNILSHLQSLQTPLYTIMKRGYFTMGKTLVIAGYNGIREVKQYMCETTSDDNINVLDLSSSDRESHHFLTHDALHPPSLQHLSRLKIRFYLNFNIWKKSLQLGLPKSLSNFVCFDDLYHPLQLNTEYARLYNFLEPY